MTADYDDLPLVYACSGCSSAAQMANALAVRSDRKRVAEMSCIAGVSRDMAPLVDTATASQPTVVIDGCPLECARTRLADHDVTPDYHVSLAGEGVPKEYHTDYDDDRAAVLYDDLVDGVERLDATG